MFSNIEVKGNEEFTLISKKVRNSSKKLLNPLFNTITALQESNKLSSLQIKSANTSNGGVYYISLSRPPKPLSYPDFKFEDSHLTVNQYYKKDKIGINNGLGTIHYTESYNDPETAQTLIVHVYFTKQGFFQHTQAKIYPNGWTRENGTTVTLSPEQLAQIQENVAPVSETVDLLLQKNRTLYNQAIDAASQIEAKLEILAASKQSTDYYYTQAQNYIDKIHEINLFSYGSKDPRGKWMANFIANMKKMTTDVQIKNHEDVVADSNNAPSETLPRITESSEITPVACDTPAVKTKKIPKGYQETKVLIQEVAAIQLKIKKNPHDVKLLIDSNELISKLNFQLLIISSNRSNLTLPQRKKINRWISCDYKKHDLVAIFIDRFWKGDIDTIQQLFPHIGHLITISHITDILIKLVNYQPEPIEQENLKKAFNFLYENSSNYNFMFQVGDILLSGANNIARSLLLVSYVNDNLFAYTILLEHGVSPNALGLFYNGTKIANINAMIWYEKSDNLSYLQLAIQYGAHYSNILASTSIDKRKSSKEVHRFLKSSKSDGDEILKKISNQNIIESCCTSNLYQELELFLPQMTLGHMLDALGRITDKNTLMKRHLTPVIKHGCQVVMDINNLHSATLKNIDYRKENKFFGVLITGENVKALKLIVQLLEKIKIKINHLIEHSPEEFKRIKNESLLEITLVNSVNKDTYKFDRCFFLFMLDPKQDFMTYQSLMQILCRQSLFLKKLSFYGHNNALLGVAKNIAEESVFSEALVKTPLYGFILKRLEENTTVVEENLLNHRLK